MKADIDRKRERVTMLAKPTFDQYVALEHAVEEAGGAIKMFHPRYLVPHAYYAALGVRDKSPEKLDQLQAELEKVPGVRSAIIDPDRWFKNEKGLDVGGVVVFADKRPAQDKQLELAAKRSGFIYEEGHHGEEGNERDEWSEMNHGFAGLCLLFLATFGMLQVGLVRPPTWIKYGSVFVWLALFVFLFIRSDRDSWPLGPISWWDGFKDRDTLQHRLGIGVLLVIAVGDTLRIRGGWKVSPKWGRWVVLAVGIAGSSMLFSHLHQTIEPSHYAVANRMNVQHILMASAALMFTLSKFAWDTWQVPRRWGAYHWLIWMGILGIILTLYVE